MSSSSSNPKNIFFLYRIIRILFPDYFIYDTYRDKEYSRIDKGDNYASDLDCRNKDIERICTTNINSCVAEIAFFSHTKKYSASFPYSGRIKTDPTESGSRKENDLISKMELEFHTNLKYHSTFRGEFSSKTENRKVTTLDDELYRIISAPRPYDQNDILLITGDIGCGKSTLLTNSLMRVLKDQYQAMRERPQGYSRIEQILVDFEDLQPPKEDEDIKEYSEKVINSRILSIVKRQLDITGGNLAAVIKKIGRHIVPVIAFDNLDSLYTEFCKKLFIENDPSNNIVEVRKYYPFIYELISAFTVGDYSKMGIRCIFAARTETTKLLKSGLSLDDGGKSAFEAINFQIELERPTGVFISTIIKKRMELIKDNIIDETKIAQLKSNKESLSQRNVGFDEINTLSVQGLRHTISVCRKLSWALFEDHAFKRFFVEEAATRLFHYLGGKTHFSQVQSGITNIFLVNNKYRIENNQRLGDSLLEDHLHTYWLKYFVLQYIYKKSVDKNNVVNLFSNSGKKGYKEGIVKLVIYSLSEIKHGRLIRPDIEFSGSEIYSSGIRCTRRATYLIKNNSFWSFYYLSLVIEDEWLEYPLLVKNRFSNPIGFAFLFCTNEKEYEREYTKYLVNKSELVMVFLDLLEVSLKYEIKKYHNVFSYLLKNGVGIPNISNIRKNTHKRIIELSKSLNSENQNQVIESLNKSDRWLPRRKLKSELKRVFRKTYYTGVFGKFHMKMCKSVMH
ncbi:MAG TPA: ATP-binding protein [Ignavibacteria bacterium]|nr:ATP-binding protein [Ignavibacteria bacterium]